MIYLVVHKGSGYLVDAESSLAAKEICKGHLITQFPNKVIVNSDLKIKEINFNSLVVSLSEVNYQKIEMVGGKNEKNEEKV